MIGLAEALFDNESEWPDELAFKKSDVLRVVSQTPANPHVADGWWLCSDNRGVKGIAPANRLKMIHIFTSTHKNRVTAPRHQNGDVFLRNNTSSGDSATFDDKNGHFQRFTVDDDDDEHQMPSSFIKRSMGFWQEDPVDTFLHQRQTAAASAIVEDLNRISSLNRSGNLSTSIRNVSVQNGRKSPSLGNFSLNERSSPQKGSSSPLNGGRGSPLNGKSSPVNGRSSPTLNRLKIQSSSQNPVKFVNPLDTTPFHESNNSSSFGYGTLGRHKQLLAEQLAQMHNVGGVCLTTPYRYALLKNYSTNSSSSNSDKSSNLSDSTLSSSTQSSTTSGASQMNGFSTFSRRKSSNPDQQPKPAVVDRVVLANKDILTLGPNPAPMDSQEDVETLSISSVDSKDSDYQDLLLYDELPTMNSIVASGRLVSLRQNLQINVRHLCTFATTNWRRREFLDSHLADIRTSCHQTVAVLKSFVDFAGGAFVNLTKKSPNESAKSKKLAHLMRPLRRSLNLLFNLRALLDADGWAITKFVRDANGGNDNLDQFMAIAKQTPDDARQVASFIHANSLDIFTSAYAPDGNEPDKLISSLEMDFPQNGNEKVEKCNLFDDYAFVDGKHSAANGSDTCTGVSNGNASPKIVDEELCPEDKQILKFYAPQMNNHIETLSKSIDDFLTTIEQNQAPKIFIASSRFVVLAAHKLIYIGDNLAQCMKHKDVADKIKGDSDRLCELLKICVLSTKHAAVNHPSVSGVQAMVDSIVEVSKTAHELTLLIREAANL